MRARRDGARRVRVSKPRPPPCTACGVERGVERGAECKQPVLYCRHVHKPNSAWFAQNNVALIWPNQAWQAAIKECVGICGEWLEMMWGMESSETCVLGLGLDAVWASTSLLGVGRTMHARESAGSGQNLRVLVVVDGLWRDLGWLVGFGNI